MKPLLGFRSRYAFISGNFLILIISWILMSFTGPIPGTYSGLFYKNLGANDFLLGVIGFAATIALALVQFPGGYLADKDGRRSLVVTMTYGVALSYLFLVFAPSWQFVVFGLMIQNFCLLYQPALFAIMLDSVAPEKRGASFTIQAVVSNLVSLPAPIIALFLVSAFQLDRGMRIAYAIALVTYLAAATLRLKLKETLVSNKVGGFPNFLAAIREYPRSVRESWRVWNRVPSSVFYLFVAYSGITSLVAGCQTYFVVYATSSLHLNTVQYGIAMAFMYLSISIPAILAGFRMDVSGRKRFLILGFVLYVPAMVIFINANFQMLLLSFFLFGMGQMLQGSSYNSLIGDLTPKELRGKVIGCGQFFMYISQAIAQLVIGALYQYVSPLTPFLLLSVGAIPLSAVVALKVFDTTSKEV
jgi:MFS family permease